MACLSTHPFDGKVSCGFDDITAALAFSLPAFASNADDCHFHGSKPASHDTVSGGAFKRQQALRSK